MPISKIAIQAGMGVTAVGGVAGAVTYVLWGSGIEYLVEVPTGASQTTGIANINITDKNYFCQWGKKDKDQKSDPNCIIKQIKFDNTKKSSLLSDIVENKDDSFETTITNDKLKTEKTWFLLKVKGYTGDLEKDADALNIDIFSNKEKKDANSQEFKQYTSVTPKFKLENNKATQGKTATFLIKPSEIKSNLSVTGNIKCKWISTDKSKTISDKWGDLTGDDAKDLKTCSIYKFTNSPKKITEFNLSNINATAITTVSNTDLNKEHYFIINFTETDNTKYKSISNLSDLVMVVEETSGNTTNKKPIATFTIEAPLAGEVKTDITSSHLILLN